MKQITSIIGLLFLFAFVSCKKGSSNKVKVAVYYEALCPDSINFFTRQLYPAWQTLNDGFKVKLVPYGKAIQNQVNGVWEFQCQHGPRECYGNKVQGCILRYKELTDEKKFDVINCLMSNRHPDAALDDCATKLNINSTSVNILKRCANGTKGDSILAAYGDKTHALNPNLSFVPTIIFNEQFNQQDQNDALVDFKSVICRLAVKKPTKCS